MKPVPDVTDAEAGLSGDLGVGNLFSVFEFN